MELKAVSLEDRSGSNGHIFAEGEGASKPKSPIHQMSLWVAVLFIVGEIAGSGVLALPQALAGTGWSGVAVMLLSCLSAVYSGIHLGKCWLIMEERWPEYRGKIRYPYPAIGLRAFGPWMRYAVSASVNITLFGGSTVCLLLCSQLIGSLLKSSGLVGCYWVLILGAILCPLTWLGTPAEFWPAAVGAVVTTALASVLLITSIAIQAPEIIPVFRPIVFKDFFLAFGTILFAFGGAFSFPTFQNDMKDKTEFPKAIMFGFLIIIVMYLPVASTGYAIFGTDVKSNVILSIHDGGLRQTIEVLLSGHFFFATLILFNPIAQELEEVIKVPPRFGWKRCVTRSLVVVAIIFTAETVPRFGKILNLVGASTVTLTTSVFPPLFYLKFCSQKDENWQGRFVPLYQRILLIVIMVVGIIGGSISTYTAISDIVSPDAFTKPCYINVRSADADIN